MAVRRPEQFTHNFAQLAEIKMHYVKEGNGEPVLLVHGWPGFWWEWNLNIPVLAESYTVIAPDMRGYGDSDKPDLNNVANYHLDKTVEDLAQLLDHLNIAQAYVVGHDWSSVVMHKFVRKHRNRVKKAAIFNPLLPGVEGRYLSVMHFQESWYSQFHQWPLSVDLVSASRQNVETYYRHFFSHWSSNPNLYTQEEMDIFVDNFMKPGNVHGGFNWYRANLNIASVVWTALDRTLSDVPTLFLWGMDDPVVPAVWSDTIPMWYTNYTYRALPNVGHFVMREAPDIVNSSLKEFFR